MHVYIHVTNDGERGGRWGPWPPQLLRENNNKKKLKKINVKQKKLN
jgi:hypothetical protein